MIFNYNLAIIKELIGHLIYMEKNLNNEQENLDLEEMANNSEKPTVATENNEGVFNKGQERFDNIVGTISSVKEKTISLFKQAGSRIGNFFKKTTIGVLSAPEIIEKGAEKYENMVTEGVYVVEDKIKSGTDFVGSKIDRGLDIYDEKIDKGVAWAERRVDDTKEFINDGIELGKDVAFYLKNKSEEKLNSIKSSVTNRYNSIVEFGAKSVNGAKEAIRSQKESFNNWKNDVRKQRLARELEKSISEVASGIESDRGEMERRAQNLELLNNRLNELLEAKNELLGHRQAIAV